MLENLTKDEINKLCSFFFKEECTRGYDPSTPIGEIAKSAYHHWVRTNNSLEKLRKELETQTAINEPLQEEILSLRKQLDVLRWRSVVDNVPMENYFDCKYDWVLVKIKDPLSRKDETFDLPNIAEYRNGEWWFENTSLNNVKSEIVVVAWRPIEKLCK
jgi:hypothetical protein